MMCWRDDVVMERYCLMCGESYYGDLGHRGCSALSRRGNSETTFSPRETERRFWKIPFDELKSLIANYDKRGLDDLSTKEISEYNIAQRVLQDRLTPF